LPPEAPPFTPDGEGWQPASSNVQTNAEINRMDFSSRIGFLGD
jgi:hypothetical protein